MTPSLPLSIVVYDTGIILQAALNPDGPAERALARMQAQTVHAIMSNRLRSEYEDVLKRDTLRAKYPILQNSRFVDIQLRRVDSLMERTDNPPERITYERDPKDAPLINLVIHVRADFMVARDKHLLVLTDDPVFRHASPQTQVMDPVEFVREMERPRELEQARAVE